MSADQEYCANCGGQKCMSCVLRTDHLLCTEDCPTCCPDHDWEAFEEAIQANRQPVLTEIAGVMWCVVHDGIADETNRGDECDQLDDPETQDPCRLVPLYIKEQA